MSKHEYTAGLIDGEGTITLTRSKPTENRAPVVSVSSTTYEFMAYLKAGYGGSICRHKTYREHHKQSWFWSVRGVAAIELLEQVAMFLLEPAKKRRAEMILLEYQQVTKRNGKYNELERRMKEDFERRFFNGCNTVDLKA